jgi:hypothetical protein
VRVSRPLRDFADFWKPSQHGFGDGSLEGANVFVCRTSAGLLSCVPCGTPRGPVRFGQFTEFYISSKEVQIEVPPYKDSAVSVPVEEPLGIQFL